MLLLRWRPRFALRVAALMLVGASCQAAFIGSGLGVWAIAGFEVLAGVCVTGTFTLWETSLQEHVPDRCAVAGVELRLPDQRRADPARQPALRRRRSPRSGCTTSLFAMTVLGVTAALAIVAVPAVRRLPRAHAGDLTGRDDAPALHGAGEGRAATAREQGGVATRRVGGVARCRPGAGIEPGAREHRAVAADHARAGRARP